MKDKINRSYIEGFFFILFSSIICQMLYSHLGFNPTDEGYMLSGSRRILDGQFPHRDYISLRPVLTQILHAHFLLWAGDRLIWWSRFAPWIQLAAISFLWIKIFEKTLYINLDVISRNSLAAIGMMASAHIFPIMPWNTIDGIFFLTVGMALRIFGNGKYANFAWFIIGLSPLTRQNFYLSAVILLLIHSDWKHIKNWIFLFLPTISYALYLFLGGAVFDAILQLKQHGVYLIPTLIKIFVSRLASASIIIGVSAGILIRLLKTTAFRILGIILYSLSILLAIISISASYTGWFHSFFLFYLTIGLIPFLIKKRSEAAASLSIIIISFGTAISVGYPTPALASGQLASLLIMYLFKSMQDICPNLMLNKIKPLTLAFAILAFVSFNFGRTNVIYRDIQSDYLQYDLGNVLRGASGIKTNIVTYDYLNELNKNVKWAENHSKKQKLIGVIPDIAQFWVTYSQPNPISSDWPYNPELIHPANRARVVNEIISLKGKAIFIVEKFHASYIPFFFIPIDVPILEAKSDTRCAVAEAVRQNYQKIKETKFYEVYE